MSADFAVPNDNPATLPPIWGYYILTDRGLVPDVEYVGKSHDPHGRIARHLSGEGNAYVADLAAKLPLTAIYGRVVAGPFTTQAEADDWERGAIFYWRSRGGASGNISAGGDEGDAAAALRGRRDRARAAAARRPNKRSAGAADDLDGDKVAAIKAKLADRTWRDGVTAIKWAGHAIGEILDFNTTEPADRARAAEALKALIAAKQLKRVAKPVGRDGWDGWFVVAAGDLGAERREKVAGWLALNGGKGVTIRTVCEATGLTPRNFCRGVMGGAAEAATSFGTLVYEAHAGRTPSFVRLVTKAA